MKPTPTEEGQDYTVKTLLEYPPQKKNPKKNTKQNKTMVIRITRHCSFILRCAALSGIRAGRGPKTKINVRFEWAKYIDSTV